jgi:predicted phosphodiesterase
VLHGHTHRAVHERRAGALVFNPGECAGMLPGHNAVGVLDLSSLEAEWLRF